MVNRKDEKRQPILEIDRLIHEPSRLLILSLLYVLESAEFVFLLRQTGMAQGNLSSHLKRLEEGGCIDVTKEFVGKKPRTLLALNERGRRAFKQYVLEMKKIFDGLYAEINK